MGSGFDGVAPAFGESPGDKPTRFVGMGGGEAGGEGGGVLPMLGPLEKAELKFEDAWIGGHGWGKKAKLFNGIGEHAEVGESDGAFCVLEVFS